VDSVKNIVRLKIQQKLSYSTTTETIMQAKHRLSVTDNSKLRQASNGSFPEAVESKIDREGENWDIIATLPKLAEILSDELSQEVRTEHKETVRLRFELNDI
jgi:hypothetical protein